MLLHPTDPERSRVFYRDTLGPAIYREFGSGSDRGTVFFLGGGFLELSGRAGASCGPDCPLATVVDRCCPLFRGPGPAHRAQFQDHPRRRGDTVGRRWTWVAWAMVAVFVASMSVGALLSVANGNCQRRPGFSVALTLAFTAFMVVGAVIVAHRPGNAIG